MDELIEQVKNGRRKAIARLITLVENNESAAQDALARLFPSTGQSHIVGITGPPGSGKSTLANELTKEARKRSRKVGIVAVDPSSPFTGGALLGDRVRMRDLSGDAGVFIRSMASRGSLGGLARTTNDVVKILDAAGYDLILVETVGAGQAEVDIASAAHTTIVIETPGMGDEIQTIKAGILEVADILVLNKADRPGAEKALKALRAMLHLGADARSSLVQHHGQTMSINQGSELESSDLSNWEVPVYETVASEGKGAAAVIDSIEEHRQYLENSKEWGQRELARSRKEIEQLLQLRFMEKLDKAVPAEERQEVIIAVAERRIDPYSAVDKLFNRLNS